MEGITITMGPITLVAIIALAETMILIESIITEEITITEVHQIRTKVVTNTCSITCSYGVLTAVKTQTLIFHLEKWIETIS